jgi:preprotein translocase subunit SecG
MFGTKTNTFLTRTTTILSILFFLTCLSLAILSVRQSRSLMSDIKVQQPPAKQALPASEKQAPLAPEPNKQVTQELPKPQGEAAQKAQSAQELPKTE